MMMVNNAANVFADLFLLGMHRISGRSDNPAFIISGIRPDIQDCPAGYPTNVYLLQ
jgi:hypothetical protein